MNLPEIVQSIQDRVWVRLPSDGELFLTAVGDFVGCPSIRELTALPSRFLFMAMGICDLPMRRHAQESRPVHQGRCMSSYTASPSTIISTCRRAAVPTRHGVRAGALLCLVGVIRRRRYEVDFTWAGTQARALSSQPSAWAKFALASVLTLLLGGNAMAETLNFDNAPAGTPPAGWTFTMTGKGKPKWTVEADPTAPSKPNVLKQSGQATFPVAIKSDTTIRDGFVEVKFKAVTGSEDRAAGVIWRAKDADNYYVVRANALEDNVVLYKTINGVRTSLKIVGRRGGYGVSAPVPSGQWHLLRCDFAGSRFKVSYDGKQLFEVEDVTIPDAGMIGLWTKADSVTLFDDLTYGGIK